MSSRWYNATVVLFWSLMTGWLLVEKVFPVLLVGEPPDSQQVVAEAAALPSPTVWEVLVDDQRIGWAASQATRLPEGGGKVVTQVLLQRLPLEAVLPTPLRAMLQAIDGPGAELLSAAALDARSELFIDALGRPANFRAAGAFGRAARGDAAGESPPDEPPWLVLQATGRLEEGHFVLSLEPGGLTSRFELPQNGLLGDLLAPPARLPGLRTGQTWSAPLYNPLAGPGQPLEMLYAVVVGEELVRWNRAIVAAHRVDYRRDPGGALSSHQQPRGSQWVDRDGRVIRQETRLPGGATLVLTLLPAEAPLPPAIALGAAETAHSWTAWWDELPRETRE